MIYLDNAATSFPKPEKVYLEILKCMKEYCANPGRGGHRMSIESGRIVMQTRETVASLFNIEDPLQVCFTKNATEALNMAIKGVLRPGDHVITTCMEHNAVIRPLKTLERDLGIEISIIQGNEFGEINPESIKKSIKKTTKMIISTLSSNVNGIIMPIEEMGNIARDHGVIFLLDASQGAGSIPIDVEKMQIDMLASPGHKSLLGPQGTGFLYVARNIKLSPIMQGGTGSNSENLYQPDIMPDLLESGTLNTPGIAGLKSGIEFIDSFGQENLKIYKGMLTNYIHDELKRIKGIKLYSKGSYENNSGIVAFNIDDVDCTEVSYILDREYGIATRAGLHCAPLAHETLGTIRTGVVRLSMGCFNTMDEMEYTVKALFEIAARSI